MQILKRNTTFKENANIRQKYEYVKFYIQKQVFLGDTNELNWSLRKQHGSSKQTVVCDVSILHS